ncbi:hypothetical protein GCM10010106_37370 [Thermopolyspora flexuosa]|nr:hypothetical protein GCM10010106_37370 [Thermopolyspora flexuosa]
MRGIGTAGRASAVPTGAAKVPSTGPYGGRRGGGAGAAGPGERVSATAAVARGAGARTSPSSAGAASAMAGAEPFPSGAAGVTHNLMPSD